MYSRILSAIVILGVIALRPALAVVSIDHSPIKISVEGQSLSVRVRVRSTGLPVKSATLFCALSEDVAPFRVPMASPGLGLYVGTVPAHLLRAMDKVSYYVEVIDEDGVSSETKWYPVEIRNPAALSPANVGVVSPNAVQGLNHGDDLSATVGQGDGIENIKTDESLSIPDEPVEEHRWVKPSLMGGGVLVVGGLAAMAINDDGGSTKVATNENAGAYVGRATTCFQFPGSVQTCTVSTITITIANDDSVSADGLREGEILTGTLVGDTFLLVSTIDGSSLTGEIQYVGTLISRRIAGTIQGSETSQAGIGIYSGSFSALRE